MSAFEPTHRKPRWQPEPLHLPAEPPRHHGEQDRDNAEAESDADSDGPGSYVTIIELA